MIIPSLPHCLNTLIELSIKNRIVIWLPYKIKIIRAQYFLDMKEERELKVGKCTHIIDSLHNDYVSIWLNCNKAICLNWYLKDSQIHSICSRLLKAGTYSQSHQNNSFAIPMIAKIAKIAKQTNARMHKKA